MKSTAEITLFKIQLRNSVVHRWKREDGQWVSPEFYSEKQALLYAKRMPMLTDEEWKEQES